MSSRFTQLRLLGIVLLVLALGFSTFAYLANASDSESYYMMSVVFIAMALACWIKRY